MTHDVILVTGATGAQGGSTARDLLHSGVSVRILTRDANQPAAKALIASGASAAIGDFSDAQSLREALQGVTGVFSMQNVGPDEIAHGRTLVAEARRAGVRQFVHTSVTGTADHERFPDWGTGRWMEGYWIAKWSIEEIVRKAGFPAYTVLRPAFMMDNFLPPKVAGMFPRLAEGEIAGALRADTRLQLISAQDVGRFAAAAFLNADRFNGRSIDLAAETPTVADIAATLSQAWHRPIRVVEQTPEQAIAGGLHPGWVRSQEWTNEVGYRARIDDLTQYGIRLTSFSDWLAQRVTPGAVH